MDEKFPLALPKDTILAGQYVIVRVLGQGGFGITYEATDHKTGQKVAVKEFFPDTMATRTQTNVTAFSGERGESFVYGKDCFLQEAQTLAQFIGNENIVRVHSYFEENGTAYFVMDFIEGTSFDEYIKEHGGRVSYEEAEKILLPIMDALAAVHSKGIVHRDVTPDNIYITKDGTVKLLDFGAARYSLGDKSRSLDVVLKHGFAPKEQYTRHGKQGPFTDVYSVGATFYFAITGRRPPDSIDRLDEDELIPPSNLGVAIPAVKEQAILFAMNVQPNQRFQSMSAFRQALSATIVQQTPQPPVQPEPQQLQPQPVVQQRYFTQPEPTMAQPGVSQVGVSQTPPVQQQQIPYQQVQQPVYQQAAPQQQEQKKSHKWILPVGIGACGVGVIAIIVAIVVASGAGKGSGSQVANYEEDGGGSSYHESQDTTEKSGSLFQQPETETTEPETQVSGRKIVGNNPNNIIHDGLMVQDGNYLFVKYPGVGLVCSDGDNSTVIDSSETICLSVVDGYLYYIDGDNRACYAKADGSGSAAYIPALQSYEVLDLWVAEDGFFFLTGDYLDYTLNYVDSSGKTHETITGFYDDNIAFMDGYVYYLSFSTGDLTIFRVPTGNLGAEAELVYTFQGMTKGYHAAYFVASDGKIYFHYAYEGSSDAELVGYDVSTGNCYEYFLHDMFGDVYDCEVNVGDDGYVYFKTLTYDSDWMAKEDICRVSEQEFWTGNINVDILYTTTDYLWDLNLIEGGGYMTFIAFDSDTNSEVLIGMSTDGSSDPVVLGNN